MQIDKYVPVHMTIVQDSYVFLLVDIKKETTRVTMRFDYVLKTRHHDGFNT